MRRYTTASRYDGSNRKNQDFKWGPSKTVPNQAMSIKDILKRVREGRPVPGLLQPEEAALMADPQFEDADYQDAMRVDPLTTSEAIKDELHTIKAAQGDRAKKAAETAASKKAEEDDPQKGEPKSAEAKADKPEGDT